MSKKNKDSDEEESDPNAWMVTFSDLLTLMLTFFVMLLTMSSMDVAEVHDVFGIFSSISRGSGTGGKGGDDSVGVFEETGSGVLSGSDGGLMNLPFRNASVDKKMVDTEELEALFVKFARNAERKFTSFTEDEVETLKKISVRNMPKGITIYFPDQLFFKQGKAKINPHSEALLKSLGNWTKKGSYNMKIEGHADNTIIKSDEFPSNWELSASRAVNILRYFVENNFAVSEEISAFGYSEFQPLVKNNSPENRRKNRRIEVVLKKQKV